MRSGAVQEVCGNGGIKNLQYKPTRAFADNISKCPVAIKAPRLSFLSIDNNKLISLTYIKLLPH